MFKNANILYEIKNYKRRRYYAKFQDLALKPRREIFYEMDPRGPVLQSPKSEGYNNENAALKMCCSCQSCFHAVGNFIKNVNVTTLMFLCLVI